MSGELSIKEIFDRAAADYDRSRRMMIPCFDDFYGTLLEVIPFPPDAPIRVVDLGAGTGVLSACVAARFPQAAFTLVDLSDGMLSKARERFGTGPRFRCVVLDYAREPLPGPADVVVSALSIHHLEGDAKAQLFRKVRGVVQPGGAFLIADLVQAPTAAAELLCKRMWEQKARAAGIAEEDWNKALTARSYDRPAPLAGQLRWLHEAGFRDVDCWYKNYVFAVFGGFV